MKRKYTKNDKFGILTIRAARKVYEGQTLFTRDGRKVKVTNSTCCWLYGKIGKKNFVWFDTGNYIGSRYPHILDIDWKRSYEKKNI